MSKKLPEVRFAAEEFLSVPVTVLVVSMTEQRPAHNDRLDREQGVSRIERARNWMAAMRASAAMHHMDSVRLRGTRNCDHSFRRSILRGGLGDRRFARCSVRHRCAAGR